MINSLTFRSIFVVRYVEAKFGCFPPIKCEAGAPMLHISFLRQIGTYQIRIQVRNLFACFFVVVV